MPGLVAPPEVTPLRIDIPVDDQDPASVPKAPSPVPKKTPSTTPTSSRARSAERGSSSAGKRRMSLGRSNSAAAATTDLVPATMDETALDNPDLGPFLLKLARRSIASGEGPSKALECALRASQSLERCGGDERQLELAMSLHVAAAIYSGMGQHEEAVAALERAVGATDPERGPDHALAAFSGYMQLGDTHAVAGRMEQSIACYTKGLQIQMDALGEADTRVAETCRYLAEAHVQAMQFDEAEKLCYKTLEIHQHSAPGSLEEAADRRLMALICEAKGDHEAVLDHLVLASMILISHAQDVDVAAVDVGIGDSHVALGRFDEAIFSYQKALTILKSTKGENHQSVASVVVRLAGLYFKTGKLRESKSYCENALKIYAKPLRGSSNEDLAGGMMEIAAIYEAMSDPEEALKLLLKALKLLEDAPGQWRTVAGIEAQMGVIYYMVGQYNEAKSSFESSVSKLRTSTERKSAFFGVLLNQMGLASLQLFKVDEAATLFEEARAVLEKECGTSHKDTLGVCSNLSATYDAMGRVEEAIELLESVLKLREEKLGTANPDLDDEKKRLAELLKEAGRSRNKKQNPLENLLVTNSQRAKDVRKKWSAFGFKG
ncbi:protein KINESIN LIGHT CHAIN-RELATED 1-like [Zingiber officinale]|nr:protein KINESIN LIGHT CHAIN-RELATED 1-like [Zingiber officinale]